MAILQQSEEFEADNLKKKVIGIASDMVMHDSGFHLHRRKAQLLYAPSGCMTVTTSDRQFVLPPFRMLWIPSNEIHRVNFRNIVAYRSIYFDTDYAEKYMNSSLKVLHVNPLLKEIIERICFWDWSAPDRNQENILKVFWNEMNGAREEKLALKMPEDRRFKKAAEEWTTRLSMPPMLKKLAEESGAVEKTISRIFKKETGLSYQDWRQQWRLQRSIELLVEGNSIGEVAYILDFSSDSAFIEFFKKHTGSTPLQYLMKNE
ncbi:AraC family transcriptional regulator [Chryseobacterium lactis]|uniref:AraC family transcriptional regulator n=1 Tax=Chryseobacterium lactis TaxID=1241981 RepID=A0A3G6RGG5_CHRLC|nr:helix-turn-helix transcriptional regulator [Chryseobacterium lactis]AZA82886.1 AraC family transcriptional regulator [Chryseobacterium lactis]AZB03268.1 AraC family transcriptional regulator [Chryseobacterium lactis]PNW12446.1 AraC family transcriptional regulator [Chryseobacterium lactis]